MTEPVPTHHDAEVAPELAALDLPDKPDGPAAATMVAAGIGIFVLGLLTTLAAASESVADFLADFQGSVGVGPLAGKTTLAMIAWLVSWAALGALWWRKDVDIRTAFWIGVALGALGAVGTFPTFFEAFE
ncbi:MAG: hypothetical protein M5U14_09185 [Acidimicrobiia bacterium]|nr:hypothetical protein [Acidimicrobiia bacterium]